jgi:hypothetical protein
MMALIEGSQRQQTGVTGNLAAGKKEKVSCDKTLCIK